MNNLLFFLKGRKSIQWVVIVLAVGDNNFRHLFDSPNKNIRPWWWFQFSAFGYSRWLSIIVFCGSHFIKLLL